MNNEIIFADGSVPVSVAARVYGKDASWVRVGIISSWLPIGKATRNGKLITKIEDINSKYGRINFYISPKLFWEETGYVWNGMTLISYTLAAMAGICLVGGLAVLSGGRK